MLVLTMKCGIYIQLFRVEEDTVTIWNINLIKKQTPSQEISC
jgi:hypothetical protein